MLQPPGRQDRIVGEAVARARDVAPALDAILITHYPDADTLDTFRLGETDLDTMAAVNMAVANELAASGVRVFVQRADRASFRRWMGGRADTQANRWAWRDRSLLRGAAALKVLGADPTLASPPEKLGHAPGPLADRLVAACTDEDEDGLEFEDLAQALLATGRNDVLDLAVRKAGDRMGEEAAEDLTWELRLVAEAGEIGPSGWAALVALPVALPPRDVPDATDLRESLLAAGALPATADTSFLPGWRSPDVLAALDPVAVRRVLADMVAGVEPRDMPPADTDELAAQGFGVLLGLQVDWSIPLWDDVAANGPPHEPQEGEETPEDAARAAAFDRWRAATFNATGCVPLALVPLSEIEDETADFLAEAGQQVGGIEDIRAFVAGARHEAADEDLVCRPEVIGGGLELSLYTPAGRFVGSMNLPAERMPAGAEDMLRLVESIVPVVKNPPDR